MKKRLFALLTLMACLLTGCAGGEGGKSELTLDQLAVRMALKELTDEDAAAYASTVAAMEEDDFDDFVTKIMLATDKTTDWAVLEKNFAHLGTRLELPERSTEEESEFFVLESFSIQRADRVHLYFHVYSTWFDSSARDVDTITLNFDAEKLSLLSVYSSDSLAAQGDGGEGEVVFRYEDRKATDPAPFDGDDRFGEVLVGIRVEPIADGEAAHSATLKHDGGKENFEITVEDTVTLP